jgi:arabinan endo-1,5-alpha-L-arabinosidase
MQMHASESMPAQRFRHGVAARSGYVTAQVLWWLAVGVQLVVAGCKGPPDVVAVASIREEPALLDLSGDLDAHDPAAIYDGQSYWVFSSGSNLQVRRSDDLQSFELLGGAFNGLPDWAAERVPNADSFWAPDVAYFGGLYHLYFALSTMGSSESCIGHATASTLGVAGAWKDQGPLICSREGDDWNAIDPSVLIDGAEFWLVFGSYRTGIKLIALDESGGRKGPDLIPLWTRPDPGMIQAAAIASHDGFYYLFSAFDLCCKGVDSTHHVMMGRSSWVRGPYFDRDGAALLEGGGALLLESDERWRGPAGSDVLLVGDRWYHVYHAFDAERDGQSTLRISTLTWDDDGWPVSAGP